MSEPIRELEQLLLDFSLDMGDQLRANACKGDMWKSSPMKALVERLREELQELEEAIEGAAEYEVIRKEAADVANFALFIASRFRG